jgi:flagellin
VNFFTSSAGVGSQVSVITLTNGTAANLSFDGVTVTYAGAATVDVGITSFIKVTQYITAASNPTSPAFNFQSGANEGSTIQVGLLSTSTSSLRITNVNVATTGGFAFLGAEDSIGQIDQALNVINGQRAALGAVITRLNIDADNDNTASVNLQASESAIRDLNVGQATADYNKAQILVQIGTTVLAQSNTNAQTVLGLFR